MTSGASGRRPKPRPRRVPSRKTSSDASHNAMMDYNHVKLREIAVVLSEKCRIFLRPPRVLRALRALQPQSLATVLFPPVPSGHASCARAGTTVAAPAEKTMAV